MTPKSAWEDIKDFIPTDKVIWEAFYGDGKSGEYLRELGFNVVHNDNDFYEGNEGDIVVSNPPFSDYKRILQRLKDLNKPFILILPSSKINTQAFRKIFCDDDNIQLIIPRKRIQFKKMVNGVMSKSSNANFDCFYYCWKIGLKKDITWIN
jgi:hypothetical protein